MDKNFLKKQTERLGKIRQTLREQLQTFATEDPKANGDWDTKFPRHDGGTGSSALEDATDEVEEYITKLPIEHGFEARLRNIELAIRKIAKGKYGECEKCGKKISEERLEASPEAKLCIACQK